MREEINLFDVLATGNSENLKAALGKIKKEHLDNGCDSPLPPSAFLAKNPQGFSLLELALHLNYLEAFQELLAHGVPFMEFDSTVNKLKPVLNTVGDTIMHSAIKCRGILFMHALLDADFPVGALNRDGQTAVDFASTEAERTQEGPEINMAALLRCHMKWQRQIPFRFNRVLQLLQQLRNTLNFAHPLNKLLVIGRTGAGKSTLLNYLNGARYALRLESTSGKRWAELVGEHSKAVAKVGEGMISETLLPQMITRADLNYAYCDLAGLFDTRSEEEQITAAMSLHRVSQMPGKIKGLLVVLDLNSFNRAGKGEGLKKVAAALAKMINYNNALLDSLHFCITHIPEESLGKLNAEGLLRESVRPLLAYYQREGGRRVLTEEEASIRFVLELMEKGGVQKISIPNITDNGESKRVLEEKLQALGERNTTTYAFLNHSASQQKLNNLLKTIAQDFIDLTKEKEKLLQKSRIKTAEHKEKEREREDCLWEIHHLEENLARPLNVEHIYPVIESLEHERHRVTQHIEELKSYKNKLIEEIAKKESEHALLKPIVIGGFFGLRNIKIPPIGYREEISRWQEELKKINDEITGLEHGLHAVENEKENVKLSVIQAEADYRVMCERLRIELERCCQRMEYLNNEAQVFHAEMTQTRNDIQTIAAELQTNYRTFNSVYELTQTWEIFDYPFRDFHALFRARNVDSEASFLYRDIFPAPNRRNVFPSPQPHQTLHPPLLH